MLPDRAAPPSLRGDGLTKYHWINIALALALLAIGIVAAGAIVFGAVSLARDRHRHHPHYDDDNDEAVALSYCLATPAEEKRWEQFRVKYGRTYASAEEEQTRRCIFLQNLHRAGAHEATATHGARYGDSPFMDQTASEFANERLVPEEEFNESPVSMCMHPPQFNASDANNPVFAVPTSFDWCPGACTPVRNQGRCGGCWAISAVEALESQWRLSGRPLTAFSEQQVISCDPRASGCGGGTNCKAFEYISSSGVMGVELQTAYPFTSGLSGATGPCLFNASQVVGTLQSACFVSVEGNVNETAMLNAMYWYGPLSVCVNAGSDTQWQNYKDGVMSQNTCPSSGLDHCVELVGWGEEAGVPYWTVRNSWGTEWGESGFARLERNTDTCGIGRQAILPRVPPLL